MEKIIWVVGNNRKEMIETQQKINSTGSMRALCMLSFDAVKKAVEKAYASSGVQAISRINIPSLMILDYDMVSQEEFKLLLYLKNQQILAGVPLFFMLNSRVEKLMEESYSKGAIVVLVKPLTKISIMRIEQMAWQHEVTKNYEKMIQKQAMDLQSAKEVSRLNQQLEARNELLYQIFGRYFSDKVLDMILENPQGAVIGGEKSELTVMMSDLRGFTSMSEQLEPEAVTALLNFYFGKMAEAITQYGGTIIEFLGDAVLSVFGAPIKIEKQTECAIAAAISMQNAMDEVRDYCIKSGYLPLEMGIGIHRGEAFIGNVGSEKMMRYNVVGKVVNECSRIESYSVGGQILISSETLENVGCPVNVKSHIELQAKGIAKPVSLSEIVGIDGEYRVYMKDENSFVLKLVEQNIQFRMYPVEDKMVKEELIIAKLLQISDKRAIVELISDTERLKLYSDVEIVAKGQSEEILFSDVYAKLVERCGDKITLHFTHIGKMFLEFLTNIEK